MSEPERKLRGPLLWMAANPRRFWAPILPFLYALSIGPAASLWQNQILADWIGLLYVPLGIVATVVPGGKDALRWYMELWGWR